MIANAAHAVAGMATWRAASGAGDRPAIGMTMFGVTTPCVTEVRRLLEQDHDCLVFHATGTGGQSMEKLADGGFLRGVIDATTTEVADFLVGGVFACSEDRFGAIARTGLPYVGSTGAARHGEFRRDGDGAGDIPRPAPACPQRPGDADADDAGGECGDRRLDRRAAQPLPGPVRFLLPLGGVSAIDAPGQPFHDPAADEALFQALRRDLRQTADRQLIELPLHINDPEFAAALVREFRAIVTRDPKDRS